MPYDALPPDPFQDDPNDPTLALSAPDEQMNQTISPIERAELLQDLANLAVYRALLEPRGIRGIVVDCEDCERSHYHDWDLLRANLQQLLDNGQSRPHEPAYDPDPARYASWEYCRGFADGVIATETTC